MDDSLRERLRKIAVSLAGRDMQAEDIANPDFSNRWEWAWYVDTDIQKLWPELSEESRWVAFVGAYYRYDTDQGLCR